VAAARFEIYIRTLRKGTAAPADPAAPPDRSRPAADAAVTWRLLSSNNRDLGRAARLYPDVETCLRTVRHLQGVVADAVAVTSRDGRAQWTWRLQVDAVDVAVSSRAYQRRVQSEYACAAFRGLAPRAEVIETPRFVQS
jgi:hypothetical protein